MGFRYDSRSPSAEPQQPQSPTGKLQLTFVIFFPYKIQTHHLKFCLFLSVAGSSSSPKKNIGLSFNYVAGEEKKVVEASRGLKTVTSPQSPVVPGSRGTVEINPANMDYVESAALKEKFMAGSGTASTAIVGSGITGSSTADPGITGSSTIGSGITGSNTKSTGISGSSTKSVGIAGSSTKSTGIAGSSTKSTGITGSSTAGTGITGSGGVGTALGAGTGTVAADEGMTIH